MGIVEKWLERKGVNLVIRISHASLI